MSSKANRYFRKVVRSSEPGCSVQAERDSVSVRGPGGRLIHVETTTFAVRDKCGKKITPGRPSIELAWQAAYEELNRIGRIRNESEAVIAAANATALAGKS